MPIGPAETALDLPDLAEAAVVWPDVIGKARYTIQVASFYYSRIGDGQDSAAPAGLPDRLLPALDALRAAAGRGVRVQLLADAKFLKNYSEVPALFGKTEGAEARILDAGQLWDGVLHAKYMLLDEDTFFVGSQNWDWRALDQIHELGVLVQQPDMTRLLRRVYELDWELAAAPDRARDSAPETTPNLFEGVGNTRAVWVSPPAVAGGLGVGNTRAVWVSPPAVAGGLEGLRRAGHVPRTIEEHRVQMGIEPHVGRRPLHGRDRPGLGTQGALPLRTLGVERLHRLQEDARELAKERAVLGEPPPPREGGSAGCCQR